VDEGARDGDHSLDSAAEMVAIAASATVSNVVRVVALRLA
jgi:hypothetical protein